MSVRSDAIFLFNAQTGRAEEAQLIHGITDKQIEDWESEWLPELFKSVQGLKRAGVERTFWPESLHWDWRKKTSAIKGKLAYPGFSIVCDGVTQGMMIVDTTFKKCRIQSQINKNLVYIEFLENAPWNRKELLYDPPKYRGIGSILVRAAIELSIEEEFKGRIGLHSLPQANSFYANTCGMTDLGVDPAPEYAPMRYFEATAEQAEAFVMKGR